MDDETRAELARQQAQIDVLASFLGEVLARWAQGNRFDVKFVQDAIQAAYARAERGLEQDRQPRIDVMSLVHGSFDHTALRLAPGAPDKPSS
jgi:hypothetical protein